MTPRPCALVPRKGDDVTLHAAGKHVLEVEKTPSVRELLVVPWSLAAGLQVRPPGRQ